MNVQEFEDQGKDGLSIPILNEKVEGDSNDNLGDDAASVIEVKSEAGVMEGGALDHVGDDGHDKSEKDHSELNDQSGEVIESQPCNSQAGPCELHEKDIDFGDKQCAEESLDGNSDAASVIEVKSQAAVMEVGALDRVGDDGNDKSPKDHSELNDQSGEVIESQPCNSKAGPCESHGKDIDFGDKRREEESLDGIEGNADAASVIEVKSQAAVMEVGALDRVGDDGHDKSEKDCSELNDQSGEVIESQPCNSQAGLCESHENDINFGDKQRAEESLDGTEGNADCSSQPIESEKANLEDSSVAGSDAHKESEIPATVSDESGFHKDTAGENFVEDTMEIQSAATVVVPEISMTEDSGEESVCGPISKENENSSVLSVDDDSISEGKEGFQHNDDIQKPFEPQPSISIEKPETKHTGEELSEEATSKVLPEPDNNQDAHTVVCENGHFEANHGSASEEPGTQSVCEPAVEIKESYQHVDEKLKPFDQHPSSCSSEAQIPAFEVPKTETDLGGENIIEDTGRKLLPVSDESVCEPSVEIKESYQHVDDKLKPFDQHPSSCSSEAQIPAFEVPKTETDLGGENIIEDTGRKLLPVSDENDGSNAEIGENGHLEVDHGLSSEEPGTESFSGPSFKEDEGHGLSAEEPGTENVSRPSFKEDEGHHPVVSVNHSVLERDESNQHVDDSTMSFEINSSCSISSTPVVASSCVKVDTDLGEPGQRIENVPDIEDFQKNEVDQEASSCQNVVEEVKIVENLRPENKDVNSFAVESVKNGHHVTQDKILETESFVPDSSVTDADSAAQIAIPVIEQAAQIEDSADRVAQVEDSAGEKTKISSPGKTASLESITGDSSSRDAHSSIEVLHDKEEISYSEIETPSHGDELDFKNENVPANAESNDVSPVVSNAESDVKAENSYSTWSKNMSSSNGSEVLFEEHPSSSISNVPIVVSDCVKPEIDLGERPGQNIENAHDINVVQGHEDDQEASSRNEFVQVQSVEDSRSENEDIDALAVDSVENGHYIIKDTTSEIQSCVPDTTVTVIDQAAKTEDSAGGDTNPSSPGANLEKKTATIITGDAFSCSDGHPPIEIHGTTDSDGEMATFNGECLDSKDEIVLGIARSNDTTGVLSEESEFKQENLSSDDSKKSIEVHLSSNNSNAPFVVSSFVKPEIERGSERLDKSIENCADIDVSPRQVVALEAPSSKESVVQLLEDLRPESEDTDAKGVGAVENGHYNAGDEKMEIKSCLSDTTITDEVGENENIAGAPGKNPRIENNAASDDSFLDIVTTLNRSGLDSEIEIVSVSGKSNDIPAVVSDAKPEFALESSSGIGSRKVSSSDLVLSGGGGPDFNENVPKLHVGIGDFENNVERLTGVDVPKGEELDVEKSSVTSAEISGVDVSIGQAMGSESLVKPFPYLIRIPKFDDTEIREQVRQAQLVVEEKTRLREAFKLEVIKYRNNCREHDSKYKAAIDEARSSKRAVKSKRAEIDSLQTVINKVKNAQAIEDIDARVVSLERNIAHETISLVEEKQFIREIKQLKQLREQLSSSIGSKDEIQQAVKDKDQIEGRLKVLRKELDGLKDTVLKAEAVAHAVDKIYEAENKKMKEAQDRYTAADNVRQEAYKNSQKLRTELYAKNQRFRIYKGDALAAHDHAAKREMHALYTLCYNQVESVMEVWKSDADFRKEYVMSNTRSTLKRLGTFDGRCLGPDEKPHVFSNPLLGGVDNRPGNPSNELPTDILNQEGQDKHIADIVAIPNEDSNKVKEEEALKSSKAIKTTNQGKINLGSGLEEAAVSGSAINTNDIREEEPLPTKEELEVARKAEELRKEELKEQRRQEEKAKAMEALERKKKTAEKAQSRAELRAQKEAEQREKEREKRLRKKERKKANGAEAPPDVDNLGDATAKSERAIESSKEPEIKEASASASATVGKRMQKPLMPTKQSKSKPIPPPLRNKGRKKLQQWMWGIGTVLVVVFLFFMINVGIFSNLSGNYKRPIV